MARASIVFRDCGKGQVEITHSINVMQGKATQAQQLALDFYGALLKGMIADDQAQAGKTVYPEGQE